MSGVVRYVVMLAALTLATALAAIPTPAEAAPTRPGRYLGNVIEDGRSSPDEKVRFTVTRGGKITRLRGRVWVVCYSYPNSYSQFPVAFEGPTTRVRRGDASLRWEHDYTVDGESYRLTGRFVARFEGGRVTGRLSLDFGPCTTRLGDDSFVPFQARRR